MIYAQIKNNSIKNVIILEDESLISLFEVGFDSCVRIDNINPVPAINWSYDGINFSAPTVPSLTAQEYVTKVAMPSAVNFANQLQADFISWNILNGITQLGKTDAVVAVVSLKVTINTSPDPISLMDTLNPICPSLTTAINVLQYHIDNIADYSTLSPFITAARFTSMQTQIKNYLGIS